MLVRTIYLYFYYYLQNRILLLSVQEELKVSEIISYLSALNKEMTLLINKTYGVCFIFIYKYCILYFAELDCVSKLLFRHAEQRDGNIITLT